MGRVERFVRPSPVQPTTPTTTTTTTTTTITTTITPLPPPPPPLPPPPTTVTIIIDRDRTWSMCVRDPLTNSAPNESRLPFLCRLTVLTLSPAGGPFSVDRGGNGGGACTKRCVLPSSPPSRSAIPRTKNSRGLDRCQRPRCLEGSPPLPSSRFSRSVDNGCLICQQENLRA